MINSFKCKETKKILNGSFSSKLPQDSGLPLGRMIMGKRDFPPIHPGEVLREEFLMPLGISQYRLAKEINVPARRINEIVLEKRGISADTALRLGRYFSTTPQLWINLQARYDLEVVRDAIEDRLEAEIKPFKNVA